MDASAEWVMAWTDLILDSTAMSEAAHQGDLVELRFRACSIAVRARRHGFAELSHKAVSLLEKLGIEEDIPACFYEKRVEDIARQIDSIERRTRS